MSRGPTEICLLTFVLQKHHCTILEDWLDFFDHPIKSLVLHVGADPKIREALDEIAKRKSLALVVLGTTTPQGTTDNELALLVEQFQHVGADDLACLVKLDTFPFREPGRTWQAETLQMMQRQQALFITGSTLPYRADLPTDVPNLLLTQRVSNCFLIVSKNVWLRALETSFSGQSEFGRFAPEGDFETYLARTGQYGVRMVNTMESRIFHCHIWGPEQTKVRARFRQGRGVGPFLSGYQDDYWGPNAKLYMQKPLPLLKRVRIAIGRWRRGL